MDLIAGPRVVKEVDGCATVGDKDNVASASVSVIFNLTNDSDSDSGFSNQANITIAAASRPVLTA
jgi:hypothetical protein